MHLLNWNILLASFRETRDKSLDPSGDPFDFELPFIGLNSGLLSILGLFILMVVLMGATLIKEKLIIQSSN